jgi:hypothetical protein
MTFLFLLIAIVSGGDSSLQVNWIENIPRIRNKLSYYTAKGYINPTIYNKYLNSNDIKKDEFGFSLDWGNINITSNNNTIRHPPFPRKFMSVFRVYYANDMELHHVWNVNNTLSYALSTYNECMVLSRTISRLSDICHASQEDLNDFGVDKSAHKQIIELFTALVYAKGILQAVCDATEGGIYPFFSLVPGVDRSVVTVSTYNPSMRDADTHLPSSLILNWILKLSLQHSLQSVHNSWDLNLDLWPSISRCALLGTKCQPRNRQPFDDSLTPDISEITTVLLMYLRETIIPLFQREQYPECGSLRSSTSYYKSDNNIAVTRNVISTGTFSDTGISEPTQLYVVQHTGKVRTTFHVRNVESDDLFDDEFTYSRKVQIALLLYRY